MIWQLAICICEYAGRVAPILKTSTNFCSVLIDNFDVRKCFKIHRFISIMIKFKNHSVQRIFWYIVRSFIVAFNIFYYKSGCFRSKSKTGTNLVLFSSTFESGIRFKLAFVSNHNQFGLIQIIQINIQLSFTSRYAPFYCGRCTWLQS